MRLQFFVIPIRGGEDAAGALNRFLGEHRILAIDRQLVLDGSNSAWAICVSFDENTSAGGSAQAGMGKRGKVDFRDLLSPSEFAVFSRLRALRKDKADAEGVPAYALFTNEQLAEMVQRRVTDATALRDIPGVGAARVQKYGQAFLALLVEAALPATLVPGDEA